MKETTRISNLLEAIYNGEPWIDVTVAGTLQHINYIQAAIKIAGDRNSIWQIVNHLISWRQNVLQRIQGKILESPADNYFNEIEDISEAAWKQTIQRLEETQQQWISFLKNFKEESLEKIYPGNDLTYYQNIHGIIQHDAYHLGQIVLLAKLL